MEYNITFFIACFGLIIGSFLNVCIYRIPNEESIAFPPSHCGKCDNQLKSMDLVPILSYIFLRCKCRYCGEKISIQYPLVELFTSILFVLIYIKFGYSFDFFKYVVLVALLIVIAMIDYKTTDVYTSTTIFGGVAGMIFLAIGYFTNSLEFPPIHYVIAAVIPALFLFLIAYFTGGMGYGDVEIVAVCGLFLGIPAMGVCMFLSFLIGGLSGIVMLVTKIKNRKDAIPFGPFIAIAALISILFSDKLINMYLNFIM